MFKLKEKFNFDLSQNYTYYSIYSNALFLNKKLNLLYNFWNKRKEFLILKKKKIHFNSNYQGFSSLGLKLDPLDIMKKRSDYFSKWGSSFSIYVDLIIKNFFDNENKNKILIDSSIYLDYTIFDEIFFNYTVNNNKKFYYYYKNKLFLNFFFKLSKKNNLFFKYNFYVYLFNYYFLLNNNYLNNIFFYNWRNKINYKFLNKVFLCYKTNFIYKIKNEISFYFFNKNRNLLKKKYILYLLLKKKK